MKKKPVEAPVDVPVSEAPPKKLESYKLTFVVSVVAPNCAVALNMLNKKTDKMRRSWGVTDVSSSME